MRRVLFWLCWPALWIYFAGTHRSRILITVADETLLVKGYWHSWFADESWGLPGGGVRRGEDPKSAGIRELAEELTLIVAPQDLRSLGTARVGRYGLKYQAHYYGLELSRIPEIANDGREIKAVSWVDAAQLKTLLLQPEVNQARRFDTI